MIRIMLRQRLAEKNWTQSRLVLETHIRPATISHYCNEMADSISLEHLWSICQALDCDVCDLLTAHYDMIERAEQLARRKASHYLGQSNQQRVPGAPRGYRTHC